MALYDSAARQSPAMKAPVTTRVAGIFYRHWLEALFIFAIVLVGAEMALSVTLLAGLAASIRSCR